MGPVHVQLYVLFGARGFHVSQSYTVAVKEWCIDRAFSLNLTINISFLNQ